MGKNWVQYSRLFRTSHAEQKITCDVIEHRRAGMNLDVQCILSSLMNRVVYRYNLRDIALGQSLNPTHSLCLSDRLIPVDNCPDWSWECSSDIVGKVCIPPTHPGNLTGQSLLLSFPGW